jgi:hypothetical protein
MPGSIENEVWSISCRSIVGLVVIHVGARPVRGNIDGDVVAGPMNEVVAIARFGDDLPGDVIDLIAFDGALREFFLQKFNCGIPRIFHN